MNIYKRCVNLSTYITVYLCHCYKKCVTWLIWLPSFSQVGHSSILKYIPLYFGEDEENSKNTVKKKQLILVDGYISAEFFGSFYYDQVYTFQLLILFFALFHGYFSHDIPYDYVGSFTKWTLHHL
jgi:hypothetical protein